MELFCLRCNSAQKKFKLVMPTSCMVINSDDGFNTANLAELRNIADLLTEAVCKECKGKLDFIPNEYSEYSKYETIDELDHVDLSTEIGPDPLAIPESSPEPKPEPAPTQPQFRIVSDKVGGNSSSWSHG